MYRTRVLIDAEEEDEQVTDEKPLLRPLGPVFCGDPGDKRIVFDDALAEEEEEDDDEDKEEEVELRHHEVRRRHTKEM